jgi:phenylacetate-CoA ligase
LEVGAGAFLIVDRLTQRRLPADSVQSEVLQALDGKKSAEEIAVEVLGDSEATPTVAAFIAKLGALRLLDDASGDSLREEQRRALVSEGQPKLDARIAKMVSWAAAKIPFYRERFASLEVQGLADLARLPTMSKRDVRENFPTRLIPEGVDLDALVEKGEASLEATSGTAEDRLQVVFDHSRPGFHLAFPGMWPIAGGWSAARIAVFTTPICSGTVCHLGGMGFEERLKGELILNSSDRVLQLTRPEIDGVLADWQRFAPNVLRCDPVYAAALARAIQREQLAAPQLQSIWCTFEYCSLLHRRILESAFGASVTEYYGGTDVGGSEAAFRCENGRYHVWEESFVFEFLRDGERVAEGELGEVVITSLRNKLMPVIRYRIGDLARPFGYGCGCAHDHWYAFELEGRIKDCLSDTSGRPVTTRQVDELFRDLFWLDFYQLIQRDAQSYELLGVRAPGGGDDEARFRERAQALLGAAPRVRYVREIPPEKSLKYRLTAPARSGWTRD